MSYINSTQGRPIQGVSQQPDKVRLAGQCTESVNFRPDVVRGLVTRAGSHLSAILIENEIAGDDIKWHYYDRGTGEKYHIAVLSFGAIRVFSEDPEGYFGLEHNVTVNDPQAAAYLATSTARESIRLQTIADTTFILNREKVTASTIATTPTPSKKVIIYPQFISYGQTQEIYIDTLDSGFIKVAGYKTPDGGSSQHVQTTDISLVATRLYEALLGYGLYDEEGEFVNQPNPNSDKDTVQNTHWGGYYKPLGGGIQDKYNVTLLNNTIIIEEKNGNDFKVDTRDSNQGKDLILIRSRVTGTEQLPPYAPNGYLVEIVPAGGRERDDTYWLEAQADATGNSVTWAETVAPNIKLGMDRTTMPVQLVRESIAPNGIAEFSLSLAPWEYRRVGDDRSNPLPSFEGLAISSIGIFQNRLFFTAGESVIMTRSSRFYDFFRESSQVALDTDPLDVFADSSKVNLLEASIPFDGDLVFFSENGQFLLRGTEAVTPNNATLIQTTAFESNLDVTPVVSGENIFFAFDYGNYTGIREYFTDSITDTKRARPVTDHVNSYIRGNPQIMASSTSLNLLAIRTEMEPSIIFIYEWLWQGNEKVQSAWGKWDFGEDVIIHDIRFNKTDLILVLNRADDIQVETIDLGDPPDIGLPYPVRLDSRTTQTCSWNSTQERWEWNGLTYGSYDIDKLTAVRGVDCVQEGLAISFEYDSVNDRFYTEEDLRDDQLPCNVIMGFQYLSSYIPTNPVAKDQNGEAMNLDRLTIGKMHVTYDRTGDMKAIVRNQYGGQREYSYGNRTLGSPENVVGLAEQVSGQHVIPIRRVANTYELELQTTDYRPLEIRDFQFDGTFNRRGRRI